MKGYQILIIGVVLMATSSLLLPDCYYYCAGCGFGEDTLYKFVNVLSLVLIFTGMFMMLLKKDKLSDNVKSKP